MNLFDRETTLKAIVFRISLMETCLKWHSGRGENDACKTAEDVVARFLAALFGWSLVNLNTIKKNYPAADLGDFTKRIAVQVTVNGTPDKIRNTHTRATKHNLGADFDSLIILFLLAKAPMTPTASRNFTPCTRPKIECWARPELDAQLDSLPTEQLRDVLKVLETEMSAISAVLQPVLELRPTNISYLTLGTLFKGRDEFLATLCQELQAKPVVIHGMGGVGKTRAAIECAWRHAEDYNALLFVSADTLDALQRNLAGLCGPLVFNLPEQNVTDQRVQYAAVLRRLGQHPGWLLIIDNVDAQEAAAEVENLLPALSIGHVVITSRIADWSGQVASLDLDVLSEKAAAEFILERTEGRRIPSVGDASDAQMLARLLDGLALALTQAAAYIFQQRLSIAAYIQRWKAVPAEAILWHDAVKMQYPRSLAITYETSVIQLSPGAQKLFSILAWVAPDPVPLTALEALSLRGGPRNLLMELENLHLVRFGVDGQAFAVHRLVQEVTRQKQKGKRGWLAVLLPWSRKWNAPPALRIALKWMDGLFRGNSTDVRTWHVLTPLASHAQDVTGFADCHNIHVPTGLLMNNVAQMLSAKAQHHVAEPLMRRALAILEASYGKNHPAVATSLNNLAQLFKASNRLIEAEQLMRGALTIDEACHHKDHPDVARDLSNLARLLHDTSRLAEAEPLMRRALAIHERAYGNEHPAVATDLNNLAMLLYDTSRVAEAESLMRRALAVLERAYGKEHPNFATALSNLARLLYSTNRVAEAESLMRHALAIHEQSYGREHTAVVTDLNNLAECLQATNRLAEAEPLMRRMVLILLRFPERAGHPHPFLRTALRNYVVLLDAWKGDELMRQAILSLGAETGLPEAQFKAILAQAFGP